MFCSVHKYKYSQENRRALLKRLLKNGALELVTKTKTHFYYKIINMEEYKKHKNG